MIFELIYLVLLFCATYFTMFHISLWFDNREDILSDKRINVGFTPSVSLIIPAYNEEDIIAETLEKLADVDYPRSRLDVIVVDDGSKDRTYGLAKVVAKKLKRKKIRIRILTKENNGKASALNFGIKSAKGEFIAVMDADSYLEKDALKNCMKYFDSENVASVTSHILCSEKRTFWERMTDIEMMLIAVTRKMQEYANVIQATPGPLSVYRKNVLKKLGGFDENALVEDIEIAWNMLKNGYKIRMALDAMVYSAFPQNFNRWWKQRLRWSIGGIQVMLKYKSAIMQRQKSHAVGSFLVPTYIFGLGAIIIAVGIFGYLTTIRTYNAFVYYFRAFSLGFNPFSRIEFLYYIDVIFILTSIMFLSVMYILKISLNLHKWKTKWYDILPFIFIYPILFPFINLAGLYKYYRGERGWLTK